MNQQNEHLKNLSEIRSLMESSTKFLSLSGLAGVFIGIFALCGAVVAYLYLSLDIFSDNYYIHLSSGKSFNFGNVAFFVTDAVIVLLLALAVGMIFTIRKARKKGQAIWNAAVKKFLINLFIPLVAGGLFCLVLLYYHYIPLIAPAMLVFYGISLVSASVFTFSLIRYLGYSEIILGLISCFFPGYGLIFWAVGFGLLHIIYGTVMRFKYER
ncbi:MAG TPA: hypothetical protein PLI16_01210 [Bacteroidales bacterium]|jgi:heme exporter protein D|nr:hypothetical protein [Bacteroidales bacterium]HNZ43113.1 hypothetical protein [Bacteroidales bacterium]HOH83208.1 hypothetical protein [Bacteroidales bacterium]HPB25929.1 hypothetical protein [Bacteroidales bacterium]HPI29132.1 hypothetical protein [Bacteroidales bacterium]